MTSMTAYAKKLWGGWTAALIAVPLVLGAIELFAEVDHLHYLLFPSTAAVAPVLGALIGVFAANVLEPGFLEVVIVTAATMLGMRLLGVVVPAVLACAIVPLFAGPDLFHGWRRTLPATK